MMNRKGVRIIKVALFCVYSVLLIILVRAYYQMPREEKEENVVAESSVESIVVIEPAHEEIETKDEVIEEQIYIEEQQEVLEVEESYVDEEELEMLACVIYQEAGGNSACDECRRMVADVVLNRVEDERFPNTIYEVLTQKGQYGIMHYNGIVWPEKAKHEVEKEAVERAYRIANEVLSGKHSDLYGNGYIWQAEFVQGSEGFWHCGTYFGK